MTTIEELCAAVETARNQMPASEALLVGISGIDASGKGYVAAKLAASLEQRGLRCGVINADGWLNLPQIRFGGEDKARHFFENAFRFDEMFSRLIQPLKATLSIDITADQVQETAADFHSHQFKFIDLDVILLEGIFLFRNEFRPHFDLTIWIDCDFDVALRRAIARGQEGLAREATLTAYETIYFPAQRLHFEIDDPRSSADVIFPNP